ncbi:MAG: sodium/solute symporter [Planctomycetota bacterium]
MVTPLALLAWLDWAIVGLYGGVVVFVAWRAQRRERSSSEFLLAGGRLPGWVVAASLLATSFSSISLVSLPSEGYLRGFGYLQLWAGELIAAALVVVIFVPAYRKAGVTTAYELLEQRLGRASRSLASLLFVLFTWLRSSMLLLLTARAVEVFSGLPLASSILLVGLIAMTYSAIGGLGAVVWTDVVQLGLVIVGLGGAAWLLLDGLPGGLGAVLASNTGAVGRPPVDLSVSLGAWPTLLSGSLAYAVPLLYVGGTNQQMVQRYAACRDAASARRAVLGAWGLGAVVGALAVFLGAALFAREGAGYAPPDRELLTWLVHHAPLGLGGVMAAAIFAAAMSSVDSAVHALATCTLVDGIEAVRGKPYADRERLRWARLLVLAYGLLATGGALLLVGSARGETVFQELVGWLSLFSGPALGLFLLALPRRRPPEPAVLVGVAAGFAAATWLGRIWGAAPSWFDRAAVSGIWKAPLGLVVTLAVAWALSPLLSRGKRSEGSATNSPETT